MLPLLVAALAAFVLVPFHPLQLVALGTAAWCVARHNSGRANRVLLVGACALAYAAAFLLNPLATVLGRSAGVVQALFALAGAIWLGSAIGSARPVALRRLAPTWQFLLCWSLLFLLAYLPGWSADIAYRGDETYHLFSVNLSRLMLAELVDTGVAPALLGGWLAAGVWLAPWHYPDELLSNAVLRGRTYRYPAAQPWLSAGIGALTYAQRGGAILGNELARMLPLLSLFGIGLYLGGDRRWRANSPILTALAVLGLLTIPNLLYHGTILYLDLPLVALGLIIVADAEHWIAAPAQRLTGRLSWWALILLGFTKAAALPILLLVLGLRLLRQCRTAELRTVLAELRIVCAVLLPLALYTAIRYHFKSRPYAGQFGNLLIPALWREQLQQLTVQCGALLPLAAWGMVATLRAGRVATPLLAAGWLVGMSAFLVADSAQYVGLARLSLWLLPPLLWMAWEGLTDLRGRGTLGWIGVALLLGANALLSPIDLDGQRADWGRSGERWYAWERCLREIQAEDPQAQILIGNMDHAYGVYLICNQIGWQPGRIHDVKSNLRATLSAAGRDGYDTVIYRQGADRERPDRPGRSGFRLVRAYPARVGGLLLFRKGR